MFSRTRRLGFTSMIGLGGIALLVAPASAATSPQAPTAVASVTGVGAAPAALPNVKIAGKPAAYKPTSVSSAPTPSGASCTGSTASFTVTNTTKTQKVMTYGKKKFASVSKGGVVFVCLYGSTGETLTFGLKHSSSTLGATIS